MKYLRAILFLLLLFVIVTLYSNFLKGSKSNLEIKAQPNSRLKETRSFIINIFAWRRLASLKRLCKSLLKANFHNYNVEVIFHVDGDAAKSVKNYIKDFTWPFGSKSMKIRSTRVGIVGNIMDSWDAAYDNEYAIFLEDDVEVSPFFFSWLLMNLGYYRPDLLGISLYTPRLNEIHIPAEPWTPDNIVTDNQFLLQLPCSWGALYFPQEWRKFRRYFNLRKDFPPSELVKNSGSNRWERSWKK